MMLINGAFHHSITPLDRGFAYGDGVFRTIQLCGGLPMHWPLHYQKLVADCATIGIVCPSAELLMSDLQQLITLENIEENKLEVLKIIITRGEGARGYKPPAVVMPTRVLIKSAIPEYATEYAMQGVRLHLCETRLATQPKLAGVKHLNRLENILARMEWRDDHIFDGLMLSQQEVVIECTMSNLFARFGTSLITPDLSQCGVAGVTRQRILGFGRALGFNMHIENIALEKLLQADEMVICNSLFGAFQVRELAQKTWQQQSLATKIRNALST
ncbi:MAG: aminodeoxychorismate lyase [Methylotenera sp.]|nr:aminodeoxychorismate lyase [Methylotenera sp.]